MFNSSVLDVAAGVAFVFLLVSTICASVREGLEHLLKTRAAFLEFAVRELLRDREGKGLARALFDHPLVSALYPGDYAPRAGAKPTIWPPARGLPSYIPSKTFAMALLDLAARGPTGDAEPDLVETTYASVRQSVATMQNPPVQRVLLLALDASQGNLERARQYVEAWYDGAMDRVSGWYKRTTQGIIFAIALAVAVVGNIDAVEIASRLYSDPAVRELVVAAAEKTQQAGKVEDAQATLEGLGVPLGWWWTSPAQGHVLEWLGDWFVSIPGLVLPHALGWLLTAFAATLGAPFWFDILNKVMVIRSTVKPHEKSPEEASEDRQPKLQPSPQLQPALVAQPPLVAQPAANDQHSHDHDACGDPITDFTRDEDLPPARGGVG